MKLRYNIKYRTFEISNKNFKGFCISDFVFLLNNGIFVTKKSDESLLVKNEIHLEKNPDKIFCNDKYLLGFSYEENELYLYEIKENELNFLKSLVLDIRIEPVSIVFRINDFVLLDKNNSNIKVFDYELKLKGVYSRRFRAVKTTDILGFEFAEDMIQKNEKFYFSDSGNKRIVITDNDFNFVSEINLDFNPFKILYKGEEVLVVSDFSALLYPVFLKYGLVGKPIEVEDINLFKTFFYNNKFFSLSEDRKNLIEFDFSDMNLEEIVELSEEKLKLNYYIDKKMNIKLKTLLENNKELIFDYYLIAQDENYYNDFNNIVNKKIEKYFKEINDFEKTIYELSLKFVKLYKYVAFSDDKEEAHIKKENFRNEFNLKLSEFFKILDEIVSLKNGLDKKKHEKFFKFIYEKKLEYENKIKNSYDKIKSILKNFNEEAFLENICQNWVLNEVVKRIFDINENQEFVFFKEKFLISILNDFYLNVGKIFLKFNKIEQFEYFVKKEIEMFPSKSSIVFQLVDVLINHKKYDSALDLLKKFPNQNQENINYKFHIIYWQRGDYKKAFEFLKKEFDLFPHKVELIPKLVSMGFLSKEEFNKYIEILKSKKDMGIDYYLNIAKLYLSVKDFDEALRYVNEELKNYPENQDAILFKLRLLINHIGDFKELRELIKGLTKDNKEAYLLKAKSFFILKEYEKSFYSFMDYLKSNLSDDEIINKLYLFEVLNYVEVKLKVINKILDLRDLVNNSYVLNEINTYLSFVKYYMKFQKIDISVEKFDEENYLSSYSASLISHKYFSNKVEEYFEKCESKSFFKLCKKILKYNPDDERLFNLIERFEESCS